MLYRVVGLSEASADWALNDGDVIDADLHPAFRIDPVKLTRYLDLGWLVPAEIETAMTGPREHAMRPRGRQRAKR